MLIQVVMCPKWFPQKSIFFVVLTAYDGWSLGRNSWSTCVESSRCHYTWMAAFLGQNISLWRT